jgi:photosystem II stability/assembly factor-like uncharacterized protein
LHHNEPVKRLLCPSLHEAALILIKYVRISNTRLLATVLAVLTLTACESRLVLDRVVEQQQKALQRTDLFQASTANDEVIVTVGSYGVIVVSNDGGQSWTRQKLEPQPSLIDVTHCPDGSLVALAMEGQVWVSQDNGGNWTEHDMGTVEVPQALTCDPAGQLWVVASFSTILNSPDLGVNWETQSFDEDMILTHIQFFNSSDGLLTGEFGTLALTRDGGQSWQRAEPVPAEFNPMASLFLDMEHGWVAGLNGTVFYTPDGGKTWLKQASDTTAPLYRLVQSGEKIYAAGDFGTLLEYRVENSVQGETSDYGRWERSSIDVGSRSFLRAVQILPDGSLLVGGGAGVLKVVGPGVDNKS